MEQTDLPFDFEPARFQLPPEHPVVILRWDHITGGVRSTWPDFPRLRGAWFTDWAHVAACLFLPITASVRVKVRP